MKKTQGSLFALWAMEGLFYFERGVNPLCCQMPSSDSQKESGRIKLLPPQEKEVIGKIQKN